jgi:hypothetical protein
MYRLLDPTNYSKSCTRLVELLNYLAANVEFSCGPPVRDHKKPTRCPKKV